MTAALAWLFVLAGLVSLDARIIAPILPAVSESLGVTAGESGFAMTAYTLAYGVLQLVWGPLGDRYGRVRVVRLTTVLFAAGTAASGLAATLPGFAGARLLTGAFAAATIPTTFAHIGDTVPYAQRQRMVALFGTVMSTAQALSAAAAGTVTHVVSWRVMFLGYAVLTIAASTALWRLHEAPRAAARAERVGYPAILRLARARQVYGAAFTEGLLILGGTTYLGVLARDRFGFNDLQIGLLLMLYGVGTLAGALLVSRFAVVVGERRLAAYGGWVMGAGWLLLVPALPWWIMGLALLLAGLGLTPVHTTLLTRATELVPEARGRAFSLFPFSFFVGGAVGSALLGRLVDAGLLGVALAACALGLGAVGQYAARSH